VRFSSRLKQGAVFGQFLCHAAGASATNDGGYCGSIQPRLRRSRASGRQGRKSALLWLLAEWAAATGRGWRLPITKTPDQLGSHRDLKLIDAICAPIQRDFVAALAEAAGSHPMLETFSFRLVGVWSGPATR